MKAAQVGALAAARGFVEELRDLELSMPLAQLREADREEWWQAEAHLTERDLQLAVLSALVGTNNLKEVSAATHSDSYRRHREAVATALEREVRHLALVPVENPAQPGDILHGWLAAYEEAPWAIALVKPLLLDDSLSSNLLHELIHSTQAQFLSPVIDDKEIEWVLGVGNRTLLEGATEILLAEILPADEERFLYSAEKRTCTRLARRLKLSTRELALLVSANSYPLAAVAALDDYADDTELLAWEILAVNGEEIGRRRKRERRAALKG